MFAEHVSARSVQVRCSNWYRSGPRTLGDKILPQTCTAKTLTTMLGSQRQRSCSVQLRGWKWPQATMLCADARVHRDGEMGGLLLHSWGPWCPGPSRAGARGWGGLPREQQRRLQGQRFMTESSNISGSSGWQSTHMVGRVAQHEPGAPTR